MLKCIIAAFDEEDKLQQCFIWRGSVKAGIAQAEKDALEFNSEWYGFHARALTDAELRFDAERGYIELEKGVALRTRKRLKA